MAWNETWMLIYTLLLVIGFSFTTTLWRKEKARAEHLDSCKKRMTTLKEERDQLEKRCKKLEHDLKLQWVWDSKHGYWIPSNASATTLMQKVPFPIMGIAKDDKKD